MIGGTGTGGTHGGPLLQCRKGVPPVPSVRFFDVRGGVTPGADRKGRAPSPRFSQQNDTSLRMTTGGGAGRLTFTRMARQRSDGFPRSHGRCAWYTIGTQASSVLIYVRVWLGNIRD